jgi:hypothetical protein
MGTESKRVPKIGKNCMKPHSESIASGVVYSANADVVGSMAGVGCDGLRLARPWSSFVMQWVLLLDCLVVDP